MFLDQKRRHNVSSGPGNRMAAGVTTPGSSSRVRTLVARASFSLGALVSPLHAAEPGAPSPPSPGPSATTAGPGGAPAGVLTIPEPPPPPEVIPALPPEGLVPPRLLGDAEVVYPSGASGEAEVLLELLVSKTGDVPEASVIRGDEPFASAALANVRTWHFEPARSQGQPRPARIRFMVTFRPPRAVEPSPEPSRASDAALAPTSGEPAPIDVTVFGQRKEARAETLTRAEVRQLPGAFGDPFRAIESLPGVTPILSGVPFFYVRGAPPGNVGYYLDGIRLPVLYHVGLGPSVVHPGLISQVDLYSGAYPARYGRFAGGIVAGEVTEPLDRWHGEWQLRLYDTGLLLEAPFAGGRGHVLVGGRYSYTAYLISLLGEDVRLEYWDYQLRASYQLGPADQLTIFTFGSFDYFGEDTSAPDDELFSSEFHRIDVRHDHALPAEGHLRTALTWGFDRTRVSEDSGFALDRRLAARSELRGLRLGPGLRLAAGVDLVRDAYSIESDLDDDEFRDNEQIVEEDGDDIGSDTEIERLFPSRQDWVAGAHLELGLSLASFVRLTPGLRFDTYFSQDSVAYSFEPRVSVEFDVSRDLTLKNTIGLAAQPPSFVVPVAGFEIGGLPGGLQRSLQTSAGAVYRLPDGMKLSLTVFQNAFFNMTDVLSLVREEDAEDELRIDTRSRGQAYGLELMFHRDLTRRLGGFLSYTLSRSERHTPSGSIPAAFDRTHVLNAALGYDLGKRWRAGGRLVFYTGTPQVDSVFVRAGTRLPSFQRLDVRLEKRWPLGNSGAYAAFVMEVLNTTLGREVVSRSCGPDGCEDEAIGPVTIPSLAFEGQF
jgi:TonB family protein